MKSIVPATVYITLQIHLELISYSFIAFIMITVDLTHIRCSMDLFDLFIRHNWSILILLCRFRVCFHRNSRNTRIFL